MRILIVDPERKIQEWEREPGGPLSFFFSRSLAEGNSYDLAVLPAGLFLEGHPGLNEEVPVFAYGPACLAADALAGGCADYLREPWPQEELEARALRFWRIRFRLGGQIYNYTRGRLQGRKTDLLLPEGQRCALELLLHRLGQAVPRSAFLRALGLEEEGKSRILDMTVSRLRAGLRRASGDEEAGTFLECVRNYGYSLHGKPCA